MTASFKTRPWRRSRKTSKAIRRRKPTLTAAHGRVIGWLADGRLHQLDEYRAPSRADVSATELAGLCFTRGPVVRLTRAGVRRAFPAGTYHAIGGDELPIAWVWSDTPDRRGTWVPTACGPTPYPDAHVDVEIGELVLQYAYRTPESLPLRVVVALLRRHGYRVANPSKAKQRRIRRRDTLPRPSSRPPRPIMTPPIEAVRFPELDTNQPCVGCYEGAAFAVTIGHQTLYLCGPCGEELARVCDRLEELPRRRRRFGG